MQEVVFTLLLFMATPAMSFDIVYLDETELSEMVKQEIFDNPSVENLEALAEALKENNQTELSDQVLQFLWEGTWAN